MQELRAVLDAVSVPTVLGYNAKHLEAFGHEMAPFVDKGPDIVHQPAGCQQLVGWASVSFADDSHSMMTLVQYRQY